MKILMMGTGPFAVPTFNSLIDADHTVVGLVTRPEKLARGRRKPPPNPMRDAAEARNIEVFAPASINSPEGLELLDRFAVDLLVVCDYGQILSKVALQKARLGGINLHGSLLPKYRGAAPINWALLNGDTTAGITVIHMTPRLDGGPMLCKRSLDVGADENAGELEPRLAQIGVDAVHEAIAMLESWDGESVLGELQNPNDVTKAPRLKKSDGEIDWSQSATNIFHRVRALQPWPGTFTHLLRDGKPPMRLLFRAVQIDEGIQGDVETEGMHPGDAQFIDDAFVVQCGQDAIRLAAIQPAGKREMSAEEFARGYGTRVRFGSEPINA